MSDLQKEVDIYIKMLNNLPVPVAEELVKQFKVVMSMLVNQNLDHNSQIKVNLDDVRLHLLALQFDLDATKAERDALKKKYEG